MTILRRGSIRTNKPFYLYVFRHSRLLGLDDVVVGFKSARRRMAIGIGKAGTPIAEGRLREKLSSLQSKGCLEIMGTERAGTRLRLCLPSEIPGVVIEPAMATAISVEHIDFFGDPIGRRAILAREQNRCFYCLCRLDDRNYVIEHVISRPTGDNSFRNVVAACRRCNDRKGPLEASDFLRQLYREGLLTDRELAVRLQSLERLRAGQLPPEVVPLTEGDARGR